MTRREFLSYSAMAGVVGAIGVSPILSACAGGKKKNAYEPLRAEGEYYVPDLPDKAVAGRELKAGVIGCGGRGSGAAENFLAAADGVTITAIGDVFPDRVQSLKQMLHDKYQVDLADENCFTGFFHCQFHLCVKACFLSLFILCHNCIPICGKTCNQLIQSCFFCLLIGSSKNLACTR